jgi:hypothetical protein
VSYLSNISCDNVTFKNNVAYNGWGDDLMMLSTSVSQSLNVSMQYPTFDLAR